MRRATRAAGLASLALLLLAGCRDSPPDPIDFDSRTLRVRNTTGHGWTDVEIRVNHYYRGAIPALGPGGELIVPLRNLVAGFGQRFDPERHTVQTVEVTAKGADGEPMRLAWPRTD